MKRVIQFSLVFLTFSFLAGCTVNHITEISNIETENYTNNQSGSLSSFSQDSSTDQPTSSRKRHIEILFSDPSQLTLLSELGIPDGFAEPDWLPTSIMGINQGQYSLIEKMQKAVLCNIKSIQKDTVLVDIINWDGNEDNILDVDFTQIKEAGVRFKLDPSAQVWLCANGPTSYRISTDEFLSFYQACSEDIRTILLFVIDERDHTIDSIVELYYQ